MNLNTPLRRITRQHQRLISLLQRETMRNQRIEVQNAAHHSLDSISPGTAVAINEFEINLETEI